MKIFFKIMICILNFSIIETNYILIPFYTFIFNPNNNSILQNDIVTQKLSEDIYTNLIIGNPEQEIKILLRLDQYELTIKEPYYNSSLSNSFKLHKFISDKFICNDSFYFLTINSSEELNNFIHKNKSNNNTEKNLYKEYKDIKFAYLNETTNYKYLEKELNYKEVEKIVLYNYGMLGLRQRYMYSDFNPDFINFLKDIKAINSSIFTFLFNDKKNEDDPNGYLIIGDKVTDTNKEFEETNNTYFALRGPSLSWDLKIDIISSIPKQNSEYMNTYSEKNKNVELVIEKSYILATKNYKTFIENIFFNDLIKENVCQYKNSLIENSFGTYICNSESKLFMDYYKNKFPDIVFKAERITDDLLLTKKDLFFFNKYNKSDTNLYFIIYFSTIYTSKWMLGRPFFEKYRLSFNMDTRFIMYHKKKFNEDDIENDTNKENSHNYNDLIKLIVIILLVLIIFFLGFLCHNLVTKKERKKKANELDDGFDYSSINNENKKLTNDFDINNDN